MSLKCFVILLLPVCALGQPIWMDDGITPNGEMRRAPAEPGAGSFERNDWDALGRADRSAREPENPFGLEPLIPELNEAKKQTNFRFGIGESASETRRRRKQYGCSSKRNGTRTARAAEKLKQAIGLHPSFREAHLNLGAQYVRLGAFQEGGGGCRQGVALGTGERACPAAVSDCGGRTASDSGTLSRRRWRASRNAEDRKFSPIPNLVFRAVNC